MLTLVQRHRLLAQLTRIHAHAHDRMHGQKRPDGRPMIARLDNFSVSNMFGCCSKTASPHDQDVAAPIPALEESKDKRLSIEVPPSVRSFLRL
jgi:hypothetical protein